MSDEKILRLGVALDKRIEKLEAQTNEDTLAFKAFLKRIEELEQNYKVHKECITAFQIQLGDISAVIKEILKHGRFDGVMIESRKWLGQLDGGGEPSKPYIHLVKGMILEGKEEQEDKGEAEPKDDALFWKHEYLTAIEVEIPKLIAEFITDIRRIQFWMIKGGFEDTNIEYIKLEEIVEKWKLRKTEV